MKGCKELSNYNLEKDIKEVEATLDNQDQTLAKGLLQPFRATNSGSRAVMQATQSEQILSLVTMEPPIVATGFENRFMENSSNFLTAKSNFIVIDKIYKYPFDKTDMKKYLVILLDPDNNYLDCIERVGFEYITESYGYRIGTSYLDEPIPGDIIPAGSILKSGASTNKYGNWQGGVNLKTIYCAYGPTTEDPVVISETVAKKKLVSPLFDEVTIMINDNDILLNLYGDGDNIDSYKTFPDIGEEVKNGILCALRREKKTEEALYSQRWDMLKEVMISDEKYPINTGTVIDISVACNNPEALRTSIYNQQVLKYYNAQKEYARRVVDSVSELKNKGLKMSNELQKIFHECEFICNDAQYINDNKIYNGIIMKINLMRISEMQEGDKITDRYGGKGVVSKILPDELMPHIQNQNGVWEPVDIIYNKCTCVNRLNPGQLFECSVTAYGEGLIEYIYKHYPLDNYDNINSACALIYKYINIISPVEAQKFIDNYNSMIDEDKGIFIRSYIDDGCIYIVTKPISESIDLSTLKRLKDEFPFIQVQKPAMIPMKDSNGNIRRVITHNKNITIGKKYIFRLKQIAEEKFSVVSLGATNIRGENTKSKAAKHHKSRFSNTQVRFGEMEFSDLMHMLDVIMVDSQLMRISTSPIGRAQHAELLRSNPFVVDIKLNSDAKSRSVEIVNAYLKTIGLKLVIEKIKKNNDILKHIGYYKFQPLRKRGFFKSVFPITLEQAEIIVDAFLRFNGLPREGMRHMDEESVRIRNTRYIVEAIKISEIAHERYGINSAEELIERIQEIKKPLPKAFLKVGMQKVGGFKPKEEE
jgi:DNA-directed RNA polymerase beta subunit